MVTKTSEILPIFLSFFLLISSTYSHSIPDGFMHCLSNYFPSSNSIFSELYTPTNSSFESVWKTPGKNLRFLTSTTPKPLLIITPSVYSLVQATVVCCKQHGLQIRTRSGGHDYEGLSYTSKAPFVILDLKNLRSVIVDLHDESAWVESGATIGELYYWIAQKSPVHGFSAGACPTVGVGGHISGGGFGTLLRKYGGAADSVVDALIVNVNGRILDRKSMGEDLFWAIRGGGGSSFGVILSWKVKIVHVPPIVTVFSLPKTLEEGATALVEKWQYISPALDEDFFLRVIIKSTGEANSRTLQVTFNSLFLGTTDQLMKIMQETFPELGLKPKDCTEMSWIDSVLYFAWYPNGITIEDLRDRTPEAKTFFKATSDFVEKPLSHSALEEVWKWCLEEENPILIFDPFGGRMNDISEGEIAFPHRAGNLYNVQYMVNWKEEKNGEKHINWMRRLYDRMSPYVSKGPRAAYLNFRDLDFGVNDVTGGTTYSEAIAWGIKYFKNNFKRLARVKTMVDPENFFNDEQSIPPLILDGKKAME